MPSIAIVGVGLIGASFGLALKKSGFAGPLLGISSPAALTAGLACGAITRAATLAEAAEEADLIYLAQPVDRIIDTLRLLGPMAHPATLITDAGSTKVAIVQAALEHVRRATFIGGHPMAGKETRGAESADADLFRNRRYVLTPSCDGVPDRLLAILRSLGANVCEMTAQEHDAAVSLTSHLPQLLSTALAAFLAQQPQPAVQQVFGSGLLDMTRLALSPATLWSSILSTNSENIVRNLNLYIAALEQMKKSVMDDDVHHQFAAAHDFAAAIRKLDHRST